MKNTLIAKRYAKAAISSLKHEQFQSVLNDLKKMKNLFCSKPEILKYVSSAIIDKHKKLDFLNSLSDNTQNKEFWKQLFKVFVMRKRNSVLLLFFNEFESLLYAGLNQKHIDLIFAHDQDSTIVNSVQKEIENILKNKIICDVHVDKSIIGGFIAVSKDRIIDASVRTNLNNFAKRLVR